MRIDNRAKHSLVNIESDETSIYRLLDVQHLFELFESKRLTLVAPKLWDDPYENFLEHCYGIDPSKPNVRINYNGYTELIFGLCWTLNQDTDATWRIYSPNKSKAKIKTSTKKLHELIKKIDDDWFRSYLGKVNYFSESKIKSNISEAIKDSSFFIDNLIENFYLIKRDTFVDEREIRLLVRLVTPEDKVVNAMYQKADNMDICQIPIEDPIDLIDEIIFDPRMPDSLVRAYSNHLKTTFGFTKKCSKSKIYESPKIRVEVDKY
jgi:hypothetical protein